jgi:hypothetical protein
VAAGTGGLYGGTVLLRAQRHPGLQTQQTCGRSCLAFETMCQHTHLRSFSTSASSAGCAAACSSSLNRSRATWGRGGTGHCQSAAPFAAPAHHRSKLQCFGLKQASWTWLTACIVQQHLWCSQRTHTWDLMPSVESATATALKRSMTTYCSSLPGCRGYSMHATLDGCECVLYAAGGTPDKCTRVCVCGVCVCTRLCVAIWWMARDHVITRHTRQCRPGQTCALYREACARSTGSSFQSSPPRSAAAASQTRAACAPVRTAPAR